MRILLVIAFLLGNAAAQRIEVQWTRAHPKDFEPVKDWKSLPTKPYMVGPTDDTPGWPAAIRIDGYITAFCDHYAVVEAGTTIVSYCWNDGEGITFGKNAVICSYRPVHCDKYPTLEGFMPPPEMFIRHGRYVPDPLWKQHFAFWGDQWDKQVRQ